MKKIIVFSLLVSGLILSAAFIPSSVSAQTSTDGCLPGYLFSSITGQRCNTDSSLPAGCTSTEGYSPLTGQKCDNESTLPAGCTSTYGYSITTGQKCDSGITPPYHGSYVITVVSPNGGEVYEVGQSMVVNWKSSTVSTKEYVLIEMIRVDTNNNYVGHWIVLSNSTPNDGRESFVLNKDLVSGQYLLAVKKISGAADDISDDSFTIISSTSSNLPDGCSSSTGYSRTTGESCGCNGTVYSTYNGQRCPNYNFSSSAPSISGVSGPQELDVNERGTWTVKASTPSGTGQLSYSVTWGDEITFASSSVASGSIQRATSQSATFTHTYSRAGNYAPKFYVTNERGQRAETSLSVKVGTTSLSDKPAVEIWTGNTTIGYGNSTRIYWKSENTTYCLAQGGWYGYKNTSGNYDTGSITSSTTYSIKCGNESGDYDTDTITINVSKPGSTTCSSTTTVREVALGNPGGTGPFERLGLDISSHPEILEYRIQWFEGSWSPWYTPGKNDIDWKKNIDGTSRRIWAYFDDHVHEYKKCSSYDDDSNYSDDSDSDNTPSSGYRIYQYGPSSSTGSLLVANALSAVQDTNTQAGAQTIETVSPAVSSCEVNSTLMKGMISPAVKCLQKALIEKGFNVKGVTLGSETGYFGYATQEALKNFQESVGLKADGILGPESKTAIFGQ